MWCDCFRICAMLLCINYSPKSFFCNHFSRKFYHICCWLFCKFESIKVIDFLPDVSSTYWPLKMLTNNCLLYIQYNMKAIRVIATQYIYLELPWNDHFILVSHKFDIILAFMKTNIVKLCLCNFFIGRGISVDSSILL